MIKDFLRSVQGAILVTTAALLGVWGWLKVHDHKVVTEERARVILKGAENAAKADAARRSADDIPVDRLRDKYCRDCR